MSKRKIWFRVIWMWIGILIFVSVLQYKPSPPSNYSIFALISGIITRMINGAMLSFALVVPGIYFFLIYDRQPAWKAAVKTVLYSFGLSFVLLFPLYLYFYIADGPLPPLSEMAIILCFLAAFAFGWGILKFFDVKLKQRKKLKIETEREKLEQNVLTSEKKVVT